MLVIHGVMHDGESAWPWPSPAGSVSIRHLRSADLPQRIAEADFIALAASCGLLREAWAVAEKLLAARQVPMLAFERIDAQRLASIRSTGTCVATLAGNGSIELQCQAQQSAFQRIAMTMSRDGGSHSVAAGDGERVTRFILQGK